MYRPYRTCIYCGAHLDHGERCDCKKEAAPSATNTEDGKVSHPGQQKTP